MILDIGTGEMVFILLIGIVLFKPKSIPDLAKTINSGINKVKQAKGVFQSQINNIKVELDESLKEQKKSIEDSIKNNEKD